MNGIALQLPAELDSEVKRTLTDWDQGKKMERLWARDGSLWTNQDEAKWLGWLDIVDEARPVSPELEAFSAGHRRRAASRTSCSWAWAARASCPEVLAQTFGRCRAYPSCTCSTRPIPAQVAVVREPDRPGATLFIVSSKSGRRSSRTSSTSTSSAETVKVVGAGTAGSHFVAITDPGSKMEKVAKEHRFRHIFPGVPRSAAATRRSPTSAWCRRPSMGLDVPRFLERTPTMVRGLRGVRCRPREPGRACSARSSARWRSDGRDKLTLVASPGIGDLGAWLEQLIAESTGKRARA